MGNQTLDTFFAYELLETIRIKDFLFLDKHSPAKKPLGGGGILFCISSVKRDRETETERDRERPALLCR